MSKTDLNTVFILSENGDDTNWLGTCRCLSGNDINIYRLSPKNWYSSTYCQTIPSPHIAHESENYLKYLIGIDRKNVFSKKPVLFATSDNGLILVSKNLDNLSKFYHVIAPDWNTTRKIVNKSETYSFAQECDVPVPKTFLPSEENEIEEIAQNIEYPCLLKPSHTHKFNPAFNIKLIRISSATELIHKYHVLEKLGHEMIVQEEVVGPDENNYMLDACLSKDSEPLAFITSRKIRQHPPNYGVGSFVQSVWAPKIAEYGFKLLRKLNFYGLANIDFKVDERTGDIKLLEINGRSHTQIALSAKCGQNLPFTLYKDVIGDSQNTVDITRCNFKTGVKWVHLMIDGLSMIEKRKQKEIKFRHWITSLRGTKSFGVLSVSDPKPFLSETKRIINQSLQHFRQQ